MLIFLIEPGWSLFAKLKDKEETRDLYVVLRDPNVMESSLTTRDSHILAEGLSIFEIVVELLLRSSRERRTGVLADPIADVLDKFIVPLAVYLHREPIQELWTDTFG